jgi:hypothetical protein
MLLRRLFPFFACIAALALGGCANNAASNVFAGTPSAPKSVVVSDFVAASEVTATDNGFNTRLERKGGNFPILERRQRTLARVNDEIVATIIADVRAAGLEAQPGGESGLSFSDDVLLVTGRLRPPERKPAAQVGFGPGRGNVVAEMTLTRASAGSRVQALKFSTDVQSGRKIPAGNAQAAAARNTTIAEALVAEKALPEKLSPDVEAQARSLGRAIAEKIIAYAKEHDWLTKSPVAEAPAAGPEQHVRIPDAKPAAKPAAKPVASAKPAAKPLAQKPSPKRVDAPEDEEPPDTNVPEQPGSR